jgi:hypothetical protein
MAQRWLIVQSDAALERAEATRVIETGGRADPVDPQALRRLAQRRRRVAPDACIERPARQFPPEGGDAPPTGPCWP